METPRRVIDMHVHIFPDKVAAAAMPGLQANAGVTPTFDGTLGGLRAALRRAGAERAVVQPVATRPDNVASVNDWAAALADDTVVAFGAMHPDLADPGAEMARMRELGLKGFKLHPEFQAFRPDEARLQRIYEAAVENGLVVFFHAGEDLAIPTVHSTPEIFARVLDRHPSLIVVLAHMGGWRQWDDVLRLLAGREVYLDTSYTLGYLPDERFIELVEAHGPRRTLFGSDAPWADIGVEAARIAALGLADETTDAILFGNAERLLA